MRIHELQEVFFTLSPEQREVLLQSERETFPVYDQSRLVGASDTYKTSSSQPIQSLFEADYSLEELNQNLRVVLDAVISYAQRGSNYCYASIGTLADVLGLDKWTVNHRLRKLAELGYLALTKEPSRLNADPSNPYHWRLKSYLHPVLLEGEDRYISQILTRYSKIESGLLFEWRGEKRSEIIDNLLESQVVVVPTVEGEKRPAFSVGYWMSLSKEKQRSLLLQSPTDLIIQVPAGITVLDFDSHDKLKKFLDVHPEVSENLNGTFTVKTPRGYHFWFKNPQKFISSNTEFFDIRSEGAWLVVSSGAGNREVYRDETIKLMSPLLGQLLEKHESYTTKITQTAFAGMEILEGNRNNVLFRFARGIRRKFQSYSSYALEVLREASRCVVPLPSRELERLIRHAWTLSDKTYAYER